MSRFEDIRTSLERSALGLTNQPLSLETFSRIASSLGLSPDEPASRRLFALDAADHKSASAPVMAPADPPRSFAALGGRLDSEARVLR